MGGSGLRGWDLGFRVSSSRVRVQVSGFRVQGLGFGVEGLELEVQVWVSGIGHRV